MPETPTNDDRHAAAVLVQCDLCRQWFWMTKPEAKCWICRQVKLNLTLPREEQ